MTENRPLSCTVVLPIGGLPWAMDGPRAEAVLTDRPGVLRAQAHPDRGTAIVTYDQHQTTAVALWNWLVDCRAYHAREAHQDHHDHDHDTGRDSRTGR